MKIANDTVYSNVFVKCSYVFIV